MQEPTRITDIDEIVPWLQPRFQALIKHMVARGFDPIIFETYRTGERQKWLYGKGRTKWELLKMGVNPKYAQPNVKAVTQTLQSRHMVRKAADIISKSRGWSHPAFYSALREEAEKLGLTTLRFEECHVEWS